MSHRATVGTLKFETGAFALQAAPSLDNGAFSPTKTVSKESKPEPLESKEVALRLKAVLQALLPNFQGKHLPKAAKPVSQEHHEVSPQDRESSKEAGRSQLPLEREPWEGPGTAAREQSGPATEKGATETQPAGSTLAPLPPPQPCCPNFPRRKSGRPWISERAPLLQSLEEGPLGRGAGRPGLRSPGRPGCAPRRPEGLRCEAPGAGCPQAQESALPAVRRRPGRPAKGVRFPDDTDTNKKLRRAPAKARRGRSSQPDAGLPAGLWGQATAQGARRTATATAGRRWWPSPSTSTPTRGSGGRPPRCRTRRRCGAAGGRREPAGLFAAGPYASPYACAAGGSSTRPSASPCSTPPCWTPARTSAATLHHQLFRRQRGQRERATSWATARAPAASGGERGLDLVPGRADAPLQPVPAPTFATTPPKPSSKIRPHTTSRRRSSAFGLAL